MPGEHGCVGGHGIAGEHGGMAWLDGGRYGKVGELTEEELVENDDLTNWSASWIWTDSSCVPSCKVPTAWFVAH